MLTGLEIAAGICALLVGLTGTWSPCGLSMVETLGPRGHAGGARTTLAACITFALGALAGAVATFGVLALLGELVHGAGGRTAYLAAAAIAAAAALAELRGIPLMPQVRRQLPEHWRRLMPMPVAAAAYGVLLGLGFTTFVLTFGVWALMGISAAVGSPVLGLVIGIGFGVGRALPIVAIAPAMETAAGVRASELMVERPAIYRGFRLGDALALGLTALLLTGAEGSAAQTAGEPADGGPTATAAARFADGSDPSLAGADVAFERAGVGMLRRRGVERELPGADPALSGDFVAVRAGDVIRLLRRTDLAPVRSFRAEGVDAIAVGRSWLVYRTRIRGVDRLVARRTAGDTGPTEIARVGRPGQLSRPSLWGSRVAYAVATRRSSRITLKRLGGGRRVVVPGTRRSQVFNPALRGRHVLYVRTTPTRQQLRLKRFGRRSRVIASRAATSRRDRGYTRGRRPHRRKRVDLRRSRFTLWTTALGPRRAFVTRLIFTNGRADAGIVTARR